MRCPRCQEQCSDTGYEETGHRGLRFIFGKPKGFDGNEVERYFREGKINEIADYCESDVVGTYQMWLRYELFRGTLSQDAFRTSQRNLADFMNRKAASLALCSSSGVSMIFRKKFRPAA
jgi:predicted PolB exonuclease-like 3'-5' exonuclease